MSAPRTFFKSVFVLALLLLAAIVGGSVVYKLFVPTGPPVDPFAGQRAELKRAVVLAGSPLVDTPTTREADYDVEASRLATLYNNRALQFEDPELSKLWAQITTQATEGLAILQRIGALDATKPSGTELIARTVQDGGTKDANADAALFRSLTDRLSSEADKSILEQQFRTLQVHLDESIAGLQQIATNLSRHELPNAIAIRYLPSWEGRFWGDKVIVENTSGAPLQDAIIVVTTHMRDGSSRNHLHYVTQWPASSSLSALYPFRATDYAPAQAGERPERIDATVYTPTGTAHATENLTPQEWDTLVQHFCSQLTFSGNYLGAYAETDTGKTFDPGYQFQFQGVPTLPVTSIELRFTLPDGAIHAETFTPNGRVVANSFMALRSAQFAGEQPAHVEYTLTLADTNYRFVKQAY